MPKPPDGGLDGKPSSPTQASGVWPRGIEAYSVFRPLRPLHMALAAQNRGGATNVKEFSQSRDGCSTPISFLSMTGTVLKADGKPAARTNSLEGRRETDLQDKPLDGRRETDQQADNAGASERETQRCPNRLTANSTGNRVHQRRHLECGLEESRPTPFLGGDISQTIRVEPPCKVRGGGHCGYPPGHGNGDPTHRTTRRGRSAR